MISEDSHANNLDDLWLEYVHQTASLYRTYEYAIPMRQLIFKTFLLQEPSLGCGERIKRLVRPFFHRRRTVLSSRPLDHLIYLDSKRSVFRDTLSPVACGLQQHGARVGLLHPPGIEFFTKGTEIADITMFARYRRRRSPLWREFWEALLQIYPNLADKGRYSYFRGFTDMIDAYSVEFKRILEHIQPRRVIVTLDQYPPASVLCIEARRMKIRTSVLMHGAVLPYNFPLTADEMIVWGDIAKAQLEKIGVSANRLVALGSPRHDVLVAEPTTVIQRNLPTILGLTDLPIFVFFSNGNDPRRNGQRVLEEAAAWLEEAADRLGDRVHVVVRLHPNEDGGLYRNKPGLVLVREELSAFETIAGADCVGSICSTAMIEALLVQKPVLQFYARSWPELADNWRRGLAQRITSADELTQYLADLCSQQKETPPRMPLYSRAILESVFANRGRATEAIVDYFSST